jgi:hypothetical protein
MVVAALAAAAGVLAACGSETARTRDPNPATAAAYRGLSDAARLAAAAGCRDRAALCLDCIVSGSPTQPN